MSFTEANHKAHKGRLTKYDKPPYVAKGHSKSVKDLTN